MSDHDRYIIPPTFDEEGVQVTSGLLHNGMEVPSSTPIDVPTQPGPTLSDMIRRMIQGEVSRQAAEIGFESFEEAEDFDVDDDEPEGTTPYEEMFLRPPTAPETPPVADARTPPEGTPPGPAGTDPPTAPVATSHDKGEPGGPKP